MGHDAPTNVSNEESAVMIAPSDRMAFVLTPTASASIASRMVSRMLLNAA